MKGPYEADEEAHWQPCAAGCEPGRGSDALSAEREAALKAMDLLHAIAAGEPVGAREAWRSGTAGGRAG